MQFLVAILLLAVQGVLSINEAPGAFNPYTGGFNPAAGQGQPGAPNTKLLEELGDAELVKEIEKLVGHLDEAQLDKLETILSKDLDTETEFAMLLQELQDMGMDKADIEDMEELANMMHEFLRKVPKIEEVMQLKDDEFTLKDHSKLYLLGLPNKLGPLGFLALHSTLLGDHDEEIVDVKVEGFVPEPQTAAADQPAQSSQAVTSVGDIIARRRRAIFQN